MSFWLQNAPYQDYQSTPTLPAHTHTVIIGGGITGVSAAYWLRRYGVEVTLLEARGLAGGATGRNGGHIVSGPAVEYGEALRRYGPHTARALYQFTLDTIAAIQAFIQENNVECDLSLAGTVILALTAEEKSALEQTARHLESHALPFAWWDAADCAARTHSPSFQGGLFNPQGGQLWPAKLVFGIAEQALKLGANIYTQTQALSVKRDSNGLSVETSRGTLQAESVIYATNAWTRKLLPELDSILTPVRGQVILTAPAPALWPFGLVTDFGYEYFIQRPDGRIILGGMRPRSSTQELGVDDDSTIHPQVSQGLREFLPQHFPALKNIAIEQEWTGIMGWTPDLNPLVGPLPNRPHEYIAAGYSGHGMPITFGAGQSLAKLIANQPTSILEAFSPARYLK
jgi:gamma-glutamylputrescine oxidase